MTRITNEHWLDVRKRENKPLNLEHNVIRISANDMLKLHQYKNELLGTKKSLAEASEENSENNLEKN